MVYGGNVPRIIEGPGDRIQCSEEVRGSVLLSEISHLIHME